MPLNELKQSGFEVFQCAVSKIKFWIHEGKVWATFENTRFHHLAEKAICWGDERRLENIIEFQKGVYNR